MERMLELEAFYDRKKKRLAAMGVLGMFWCLVLGEDEGNQRLA